MTPSHFSRVLTLASGLAVLSGAACGHPRSARPPEQSPDDTSPKTPTADDAGEDSFKDKGTVKDKDADKEKDGLALIPAGCFEMGSDDPELDYIEIAPAHRVCVDAFRLERTEVTQGDFERVMGENPSTHQLGDDHPVQNVTIAAAYAYCEALGRRLPTAAEWEYAAKGGKATPYWWGNAADHSYANYGQDKCCEPLAVGDDRWEHTAPVGSFPANPFGLFDMNGNVWEFTSTESYGYKGYGPQAAEAEEHGAAFNPAGKPVPPWRPIYRGGAFSSSPEPLRSDFRRERDASTTGEEIGFRCAADVKMTAASR